MNSRNKKLKKRTKRANKPDVLRDMDEMAKELLKANNLYSLYQNFPNKGIRVAENQNQTRSRTVNRDKLPKKKM